MFKQMHDSLENFTHYSFIELSSVPITSPLLGSFRQFNFSLIIITKQHRLLRVVCTLSSHIGLMVTHKGSNCALHCRNTLHSLKTQTILTTSDQWLALNIGISTSFLLRREGCLLFCLIQPSTPSNLCEESVMKKKLSKQYIPVLWCISFR